MIRSLLASLFLALAAPAQISTLGNTCLNGGNLDALSAVSFRFAVGTSFVWRVDPVEVLSPLAVEVSLAPSLTAPAQVDVSSLDPAWHFGCLIYASDASVYVGYNGPLYSSGVWSVPNDPLLVGQVIRMQAFSGCTPCAYGLAPTNGIQGVMQ